MKNKNLARKKLGAEEQVIVGNIKSLLAELEAGDMGGEEVMMADKPPMEEDEAVKANMGPTANPEEKAEDRVEAPTDITAANLSEVGKSLKQLVNIMSVRKSSGRRSRRVQKNNSNTDSMILKSLASIAVGMKQIAERQSENDQAISNILEGFGVADALRNSGVEKSAQKPVVNTDTNAVVGALMEVMKGLQTQEQNKVTSQNRPANWDVNKSRSALASVLPGMLKQ